ncbi:MAG: MipA/OmpV family protein [Planctomycetota bacterium]
MLRLVTILLPLALCACTSTNRPVPVALRGAAAPSPVAVQSDTAAPPTASPEGDPAAETDAPPPPGTPSDRSLFLTVGPGAAPQFEGASSYQLIPFTVVRFRDGGFAFESEGLEGRFDLVPPSWNTGWGFGPSFAFRLPRRDTGDATIDALDSVGTAFEVGGFARYIAKPGWLGQDSWETRMTVTGDTTGAHNGVVAQLDSDYAWFPKRNIRLSFGLRASWASNQFMNTYFQVTPEGAARSGLAPYDPEPGLRNVGAQASILFLFNPNHGVFALVRYDQLVDEVANSPIVRDVGSAEQWLVGAGYSYRF